MKGCALTAVAILILMTATCVAANQHDERIWTGADRVRPGMSAAEAKQILGQPSWVGRCGSYFGYGWEDNCAADLGYRAAFAPLVPSYIVVELDRRQRVLSVAHVDSP
jgi:hypothetical protein